MDEKIKFMREALKRAKKGLSQGEVPVGAVIVYEGKVIASGYNRRTKTQMATSHAEMYAIDRACRKLKSWRLCDCDLYVTLEPCIMCAGTMVQARIDRLVYGAVDFRYGAAGSIYDLVRDSRLNHWIDVTYGVMEEECGKLLRKFFSSLRKDD